MKKRYDQFYWIYFAVKDEYPDYIKIGKSINPFARLKMKAIEVSPANIVGLYLHSGGNKYTEDSLHEKFSKYKKDREWFYFSDEIKQFIEESTIKATPELELVAKRYAEYIQSLRNKLKIMTRILEANGG